MTYQEAIEFSMKVKWKTTPCFSGEDCWCRVIEPEIEIKDENENKITIVDSGSMHKEYADYIVRLHNSSLEELDNCNYSPISSNKKIQIIKQVINTTKSF